MSNEDKQNEGFEPLKDSAPVLEPESESVEPQATEDPATESTEASPVEKLQMELDELKDRWLRSQAELDNVRRRARRDVEDQIKFASQNVISDLLEVVDNLNRALDASGEKQEAAGVAQGVRMVIQQFEDVLKRHGCERLQSHGQPFDPNIHEAIQMVPHQAPSGTVVQEVRSGYRLHDRVIRPAQVIVSAGQ